MMPLSSRTKTILAALCVPARLYLGVIFIAASVYKIYDPAAFAQSVATYQIAPLWTINIFAVILPFIEFFVGATLILGAWTRESAFIISGMMVMFTVMLSIALARDLKMSCGCFASQETVDEISLMTVWRDLIWLGLGIFVMLADDGRFGLDRWLLRKRSV